MLETLLFVELFYVTAVLLQAGIAALCGVRVERISFGFGPKLLRLWRFQITWIPLGGYVRLAGLHPTERAVGNDDRRAFFARPLPLRLLTVLGWPIGAQLFLSGAIAATLLHFGTPATRVPPAPADAVVQGLQAPLGSQRQLLEAVVELARRREVPRIVLPVETARMVAAETDDIARIDRLVQLGSYLVLGSLLPIPPLPGAQFLAVLFGWRSRRGRNDFAAHDVGEVILTERSFPLFVGVALLALAAVAVLAFLGAGGAPEVLGLIAVIALLLGALGAGWPRAWAWGIYVPLGLAPSILLSLRPEAWLVAAILLVTPLALGTPGVRRYFRQECPVCHQLGGRPVRSSRGHYCLACGSVWRPE
jgi:membrane-associated protease RseP (regulator of RpoE activity)